MHLHTYIHTYIDQPRIPILTIRGPLHTLQGLHVGVHGAGMLYLRITAAPPCIHTYPSVQPSPLRGSWVRRHGSPGSEGGWTGLGARAVRTYHTLHPYTICIFIHIVSLRVRWGVGLSNGGTDRGLVGGIAIYSMRDLVWFPICWLLSGKLVHCSMGS